MFKTPFHTSLCIESHKTNCDAVIILPGRKAGAEQWIFCHSFIVFAGSAVLMQWFDAENKRRLDLNSQNPENYKKYVIMSCVGGEQFSAVTEILQNILCSVVHFTGEMEFIVIIRSICIKNSYLFYSR